MSSTPRRPPRRNDRQEDHRACEGRRARCRSFEYGCTELACVRNQRPQRNVWPPLAETLGVETGPDMPTSVAAYLEENADVWDQIVAKYDLRSRNLRELVGHGDQHADFAFAYGARKDLEPS